MTNQSFEEIKEDQIFSSGFEAGQKQEKKKINGARLRISWVLNTLLSAGTNEDDECIIELKKAIRALD